MKFIYTLLLYKNKSKRTKQSICLFALCTCASWFQNYSSLQLYFWVIIIGFRNVMALFIKIFFRAGQMEDKAVPHSPEKC